MLASVNSNKTLPCLVLIEYGLACGSREKVLSDQLIKGCCIDRLSWQRLPVKWVPVRTCPVIRASSAGRCNTL